MKKIPRTNALLVLAGAVLLNLFGDRPWLVKVETIVLATLVAWALMLVGYNVSLPSWLRRKQYGVAVIHTGSGVQELTSMRTDSLDQAIEWSTGLNREYWKDGLALAAKAVPTKNGSPEKALREIAARTQARPFDDLPGGSGRA